MGSSKKTTLRSLKAGRPPLAKSSRPSMTRKTSRALINNHHQLEKRRLQAAARGDKVEEALMEKEITKFGGIDHYQKASLQGQSHDRGGDTSRVLLGWLPAPRKLLQGQTAGEASDRSSPRLRMLEVGSLSTCNACSTSGIFDVVHIDLNSQEPGIQQQDFMQRPLPRDASERFDIISLSLVVNFVPDAAGRGHMLRRTLDFLHEAKERGSPDNMLNTDSRSSGGDTAVDFFPSLFMVLPRSCLENSRYMTEKKFEDIMKALGYIKLAGKITQKLTYSLWRRELGKYDPTAKFTKKEVNPGRTRNNFAIVLNNLKGP
ncbi:25S rRNA (adenine2142-N1)-methyltransferase [Geosmithia morbida]|uniref:25S rRNA adenine-N(1) methyltransferase n=1 Tax=Geosmithia morbida TaxID=1094350 RepID=A0A9P4YRH6_9HYPO|nr:25S rRNA (adenine2142-N1)-methyltransferase [Geosmithia morbida]KAF4120281.1 25S rRNA (adenine2142-N1)-methyltransferase [Geosmithia morbida]